MRIKAIFVEMLKHFVSNQNNYLKGFLLSLLIIVCCTSCFKNLTKLTVIYENNFDDYNLKGIKIHDYYGPVSDIKIQTYNGNPVLGRFNSSGIELSLTDLPQHTAMSIEFDLYIHDIWKNDLWKYSFDGADQLLTGFSNDSTIQQSYPHWLGNGSSLYPATSGAYTNNLPGACILSGNPHGTSLYKIARTFLHTNSTFDCACSDAGDYFNLPCNRSWSMDNLKITLINN